jgi:hypothetical protein
MANQVTVRSHASPILVLLAMDWIVRTRVDNRIFGPSIDHDEFMVNHRNDENLLEIKGNSELTQTYFAEFMRPYEHYRARALWNMSHPATKGAPKEAVTATSKLGRTFTLKTTRDGWVKAAYKSGTPEYLARTLLARGTH